MLALLGKRSPLLLRAFLTAVSAVAAICFVSAFSAPAAKVALPSRAASGLLSDSYVRALAADMTASKKHAAHMAHLAHIAALAERAREAKAAALWRAQQARKAAAVMTVAKSAPAAPAALAYSGGVMSAAQVGQLWLSAGGPSWAEPRAVEIAYCESSFNPRAHNPSGASGIWQILGAPRGWTGSTDWFTPSVNAAAAVAKFRQADNSFAPWVCQ